MAKARDPNEFTLATKQLLAKRVNYLCSLCGCQTVGPKTGSTKAILLGDAAHIHSASPKGPRPNPSLTREQLRSPENGIWLCVNHARLVDADESRYSVKELRAKKEKAEAAAREALEDKKKPEAASAPVLTFAPVNNFNPVVNLDASAAETHSSTLAMLRELGAQITFPQPTTAPRVTSEQWQQLRAQFEALHAPDMELWCDDQFDGTEAWTLHDATPDARQRAESLARYGGRLLLTSDRVTASLSEDVRAEPDDVRRWFRYVATLGGMEKDDVLTVELQEAGEVTLGGGRLDRFVQTSITGCIECAARQL